MIYLLTAFSVLISLLRNGIVVAFDDELMNAMLRSAQNHKFEGSKFNIFFFFFLKFILFYFSG